MLSRTHRFLSHTLVVIDPLAGYVGDITAGVVFGKKKLHIASNITLNGNRMVFQNQDKCIGMTLEQQFYYKEHIHQLSPAPPVPVWCWGEPQDPNTIPLQLNCRKPQIGILFLLSLWYIYLNSTLLLGAGWLMSIYPEELDYPVSYWTVSWPEVYIPKSK